MPLETDPMVQILQIGKCRWKGIRDAGSVGALDGVEINLEAFGVEQMYFIFSYPCTLFRLFIHLSSLCHIKRCPCDTMFSQV